MVKKSMMCKNEFSSDIHELRRIAKELGIPKYYTLRRDILKKKIIEKHENGDTRFLIISVEEYETNKKYYEEQGINLVCKHKKKIGECKVCVLKVSR